RQGQRQIAHGQSQIQLGIEQNLVDFHAPANVQNPSSSKYACINSIEYTRYGYTFPNSHYNVNNTATAAQQSWATLPHNLVYPQVGRGRSKASATVPKRASACERSFA